MKYIVFVVNPKAGHKTVEEFEQTLKAELEQIPNSDADYKIDTLIPKSPDEMRETLERYYAVQPIDVLGVVGGDGSIMEALPFLVKYPNVKLALIPYGTGNLLAANLGIPTDFTSCVDTLFNGNARRIDLARINDSYFCLLAGVGVVADIMENTPRKDKKRFGVLAYLINGIRTILQADRSHFTVTTENRKIKARGVAVLISNAASILGPCLPLTPNATPDDGLLDICIIKSLSNRDYLSTIMEILLRTDAGSLKGQNVINFRTRHLKIKSSRKMKVQADGNIIGTTPVEIEIIRNRLQIIVPASQFDQDTPSGQRSRNETSMLEALKRYLKTDATEAGSGVKA